MPVSRSLASAGPCLITMATAARSMALRTAYMSRTLSGVISMTKTLAVELAPSGIRVNAIAPGLVETKFAAAITQNDDLSAQVKSRTPQARIAEPDEIAGAALFLVSDAASFVTGHTLVIDGGMTVG